MSRRMMAVLALVVMTIGGWMLWHKDRIQSVEDAWQLAREQFARWSAQATPGRGARPEDRVRLASFRLGGGSQSADLGAEALPYLAEILAEFDAVALQDVPVGDGRPLDELVRNLNARGGRFAFVLPPATALSTSGTCAFVYNQSRLTLEGAQVLPVEDLGPVLRQPPFIGWFRCGDADPEQAFTFSLVNVQLAAQNSPEKLSILGELFRLIRSDGRGEDDVILAGNLNASESELAQVRQQLGLTWLIRGIPTNVQLDRQTDNLLLDPLAGSEYTGRSGALDFVKRFNLSLADAQRISLHLPVWAEFVVWEGATPMQTADGGEAFSAR